MSSQASAKQYKFYANLCIGSFVLCASFHSFASETAGEVTFLLGKAYLNGKTEIHAGTEIHEGDRIDTLANGHVHIRFIDNGLVSVRPKSTLTIDLYKYNSEQPSDSIIKFTLDDGVARSISGSGAKSARDKFRFNTPIAAIGVRGTDFVVNSNEDTLQALVNEGAILVSPFSDDCSIQSIGPCTTDTVELTALSNQFIEFDKSISHPRLLNTTLQQQVIASAENNSEVQTEEESKDSVRKNHLISENSAYDSLPQWVANSSSNFSKTEPDTNIFWGRYNVSQAQKFQSTASFDEASSKGDINTAILATSESGWLVSFRAPSQLERVESLDDVYFQLSSAEAFLSTPSGSNEPVAITDTSLSINFSTSQFTTKLSLFHPLTSQVKLDATGDVLHSGYLIYEDSNTLIQGATTFDADQSSYFFSKGTDVGAIEGLTYWRGSNK